MTPHRAVRVAALLVLIFAAGEGRVAAQSTTYTFSTFSVGIPSYREDGVGTAARFLKPTRVAIDANGNVYVADTAAALGVSAMNVGAAVRKIAPGGVVSTVTRFGSSQPTSSIDVIRLSGIGTDGAGSIYVMTNGLPGNCYLRRMSPGGVEDWSAYCGNTALYGNTEDLAVDAAGTLYMAYYSVIWKIVPNGSSNLLAGGSQGSADGTGASAQFRNVRGIAVDSSGTVYVADTGNHTIRRITPDGVVTTLAGLAGASGSTDGTGADARFSSPVGIAVAASGTVYVADTGNHTIRAITPAGVVTTVAGAAGTSGGSDGTRAAARFNGPQGVAVASDGTVYVADTGNLTIRTITPAGVVTTIAGFTRGGTVTASFYRPRGIAVDAAHRVVVADTGLHTIQGLAADGTGWPSTGVAGSTGIAGSTDGPALQVYARGIAVDAAGALYVAGNQQYSSGQLMTPPPAIWKISGGDVSILAGGHAAGWLDGTGRGARFGYWPQGIAVGANGTVYITDGANYNVRAISQAGVTTTLAGATGNSGRMDGAGTQAMFGDPLGIAVEGNGTLYVADRSNSTIRKITSAGVVTTLAGSPGATGALDGTGTDARFNHPAGVAVGSTGTVYVADTENSTIRAITPDGVVTTVAGAAGSSGSADGTGAAARFSYPRGVAVAADGTIYVADTGNHTIRKVTPAGTATTVAGTPSTTVSVDGTGTAAGFAAPTAIAVDAAGVLYVVDDQWGATKVRRVTPGGVVSTLFATGALMNGPVGAVVDAGGNMYFADSGNHTIRRATPAGRVGTIAGLAGTPGAADGTGSAARFNSPGGVALDGAGNLYVADTANHTIRKITASGAVSTLAGAAGSSGSANGAAASARFSSPAAVAVDAGGNVYVADAGNHTIRKLAAGTVTTLAGQAGTSGSADGTGAVARFFSPSGIAIDPSGVIFVADTGNHTIRRMTTDGTVTTIGGLAGGSGWVDGAGSAARFNGPAAIAVDGTGVLYVADTENSVIRIGLASDRSAPSITTQPASRTVAEAQSAQFSVAATGNPPPTFRWQENHTGAWNDIATNSDQFAGASTATLTLVDMSSSFAGKQVRCVVSNIAGSVTSEEATVSMMTALSTTPKRLYFAATALSPTGPLTNVTGPQPVTVTYDGAGTPTWTAIPNQPWLRVTNGAGSGAGTFTVSIANADADNLLAHRAISVDPWVHGQVTVTDPAKGLVAAIPVVLSLTSEPSGAAPFGVVDTPAQNATGIAGSIGVTGWALDDVGVNSVKLYRNCLAFEPAADCQTIGGTSVVYMGDADLVPGARPDVEVAFPYTPQHDRAGWGYLLLTNMLPHIPKQVMYGGQGTISIYALATDVEGHTSWLGSVSVGTWFDHMPTTITMDNDAAAKPFGAIDTPGQGQTVSGALWNFGWALTADTNTTVDGSDILVPTNGSTAVVWIDGAPVANVTYNLCRGTVGSSVPAGVYCDDDVANIFGNPTPQATYTTRIANATRYRNLDVERGAMGAYYIDTTTMSNGRHNIVWSVTDNAGRVDGIGSRYFIVLNSGAATDRVAVAGQGFAASSGTPAPERPRGRAVARPSGRRAEEGSRAEGRFSPTETIVGRTGFDLRSDYEVVPADDGGVHRVRIPELGRLELSLGPVSAGYLLANGTRRDLPVGSRLDPSTGIFTWTPGPAYLGTYRLAFVRGDEELLVDVTVGTEVRSLQRPD